MNAQHKLCLSLYQLLIITLIIIASLPINADDSISAENKSLITLLRAGGYNLYFRHENTDWSQSDHIEKSEDWLSCDGDNIRQLSDIGRKSAKATGVAIRKLVIPVGQVYSSPYCRTIETAQLMNLGKIIATTEVMNLRVAEYFGGRHSIVKTAQNLLSKLPEMNSNTIIVAHGNVARAATDIYPEEGEALIFQPDGYTFKYISRIKPDDWKRLQRLMP